MATQEKAILEPPERPSITIELFSDFFSAVVTYFRPASADNFTATALEPQRPRNSFLNFLGFCFSQGFYWLIFAIVGGLCFAIPGFLRLRFICIQWRLRWLHAFTWLEALPALAYVARWGRRWVACFYGGVPRIAARRLLVRVLRPCYEGLFFLAFLITFIPLQVLLIVKYFFYLLVRGRWLILGLWAVFFFGVHGLYSLAAEGLCVLLSYDYLLVKDALGSVDVAYLKAMQESPLDGRRMAAVAEH